MNSMRNQGKNYAIVFLLGAIGGGLFVSQVTRAIPKMMVQIMTGMMQNMMSHMSESGGAPSEM